MMPNDQDNKTVYLVGGLPRSGSTLLINILGQNSRFYVAGSSGLVPLLTTIRQNWKKIDPLKAMPSAERETAMKNVMRGMVEGWYAHTDRSVCFDKYHYWTEHLEMAALLFGARERVKLIVTVRDLRDVVASFEKLHRETVALSMTFQEEENYGRFKKAIGRVAHFIDESQPVGRAFNGIRDAVTRGWLPNMHFVEYEQLTQNPEAALAGIYRFLSEEDYQHDLDNITQITEEDDWVYGMKDLHQIQSRLTHKPSQWSTVFDKVVFQEPVWKEIEKNAQFWRAYING